MTLAEMRFLGLWRRLFAFTPMFPPKPLRWGWVYTSPKEVTPMPERRTYPRLVKIVRPEGHIYRTMGIAGETNLMWFIPGKQEQVLTTLMAPSDLHQGSRRIS